MYVALSHQSTHDSGVFSIYEMFKSNKLRSSSDPMKGTPSTKMQHWMGLAQFAVSVHTCATRTSSGRNVGNLKNILSRACTNANPQYNWYNEAKSAEHEKSGYVFVATTQCCCFIIVCSL